MAGTDGAAVSHGAASVTGSENTSRESAHPVGARTPSIEKDPDLGARPRLREASRNQVRFGCLSDLSRTITRPAMTRNRTIGVTT